MAITYERLRELLNYDPNTGVFTNKVDRTNAKKGCESGTLGLNGYVYISIDNKRYLAHRLAWLYTNGYSPEHAIDHIDRVRNNNKISNLREVTPSCNLRNAGVNSNNTSGVKGVSFDKSRGYWVAYVKVNKKRIHLGYSDDFTKAVTIRWAAEIKYGFNNCCSDSSEFLHLKSKIIDGVCQ